MHPVGVITDRDIVVRHVAAGHANTCTCSHVMSRAPLVTVRPGDGIDEVMRKMVTHRVRRVLVVDRDHLVGVISAADLLAREGHIADELVEKVLEQLSEPVLAGV
jgi:CBS domain-containing protein